MKKLFTPSGQAFGLFAKTLLFICFLQAHFSVAQTSKKITGNLLDEKKQPLSFTNVLLLKAQDSTLIKGTVCDANGNFEFEQVSDNQYVISASMVGYEKYFSPKFVISNENPIVNFPNIQLNLAAKNLKEVTVSAKKPFIEQRIDKMVVNVENSIIATGNTALEVLQKSPGISVDNNDKISLKGKQGVQVFMDGKPTYLSQADLANLLKSMTSEQIEKIEIITNPSSRFDAAGNSGIINIITRKDKNFGTNGTLTVGFGLSIPKQFRRGFSAESNYKELEYEKAGLFPKENIGLNINNRKGKLNTFANLTISDRRNFQNNYIFRNLENTRIDQYALAKRYSQNFGYKFGMDYYATKKTTLGFMVNGNLGKWGNSEPQTNHSYFKDLQGNLLQMPFTTNDDFQSWKSGIANVNLKHTFDSTGRELSADLDFSVYRNLTKELGMTTRFYDAKGVEYGTPLNMTSNIPNKYTISAAKVDYVLPFAKSKSKIEMGAKSSFVKSDNNIQFFKNGSIDIGRTNHFIYTENINAAYTNFSKQINEKWNVQAGVRAEHWKAKGESMTLNESRTREMIKVFPTLFVSQQINKDNALNYSYSKRIERPNYESLNPFIYFLDPYTYNVGNEFLKPQYTNSFEITHTFKQAFITSVGYSFATDMMMQVIKNAKDDPILLERLKKYSTVSEIDVNKITFQTDENLKKFENYSLNLSFPVPITKKWSSNNNLGVYYNVYNGMVSNANLNAAAFSFNFSSNQNISFGKGYVGEISAWYNSRNVYGMIVSRPQGAINVGIQKSFWEKKGNLKFTVNDVFMTGMFNGDINHNGISVGVRNRWDSRSARLTFTYKFGNQQVKAARRRSTATESEQNRVKTGN